MVQKPVSHYDKTYSLRGMWILKIGMLRSPPTSCPIILVIILAYSLAIMYLTFVYQLLLMFCSCITCLVPAGTTTLYTFHDEEDRT